MMTTVVVISLVAAISMVATTALRFRIGFGLAVFIKTMQEDGLILFLRDAGACAKWIRSWRSGILLLAIPLVIYQISEASASIFVKSIAFKARKGSLRFASCFIGNVSDW